MNVEMSFRRKRLLTNFAFEVLQPEMAILMVDEVLFALKSFRAKTATEKVFLICIGMNSLMCDEIASEKELFLTNFAGELEGSSVSRNMLLKPNF